MLTAQLPSVNNISDTARPALLALSVLLSRLDSLPIADRTDLVSLVAIWNSATDEEERLAAYQAMEEILARKPIQILPLPEAGSGGKARLRKWTRFIGKTIRAFREKAGMTQEELAKVSGMPQSHISRLENGEHSPTHLTMQKIADALGINVNQLDPAAE